MLSCDLLWENQLIVEKQQCEDGTVALLFLLLLASERDTIRGNKWKSEVYRHFSSAGPVLRNVGGVKCQPF